MFRKLGWFLGICLVFGGCIRLQASAWHQGKGEETPTVHEVALDSRQLVHKDTSQADIQMPAV